MANDNWNIFTDPKPYVTVSGLAIDREGRFPLLHRSNNVRSAKNAWSLPSGLHEVGITGEQQFANELEEELGLSAIKGKSHFIGYYENIRPDGPDARPWHWVIFVYVQAVVSLDTIVNKEPDKHDEIKICQLQDVYDPNLIWTTNLGQFLHRNYGEITRSIDILTK
jgi:ADP-ribose pyrophosphatase YjhB (NUDIX family)